MGTPQRPGLIRVRGNAQQIDLVGERGDIIISGHLDLRTDDGELRARLSHDGTLVAGGAGRTGMVNLRNDSGATIIRLDLSGSEARGRLGRNGVSGWIELLDGEDDPMVVLQRLRPGMWGSAVSAVVTDARSWWLSAHGSLPPYEKRRIA